MKKVLRLISEFPKFFLRPEPKHFYIPLPPPPPPGGARSYLRPGGALDELRGRGRRSRVVLTPRRWRQVRGGDSADDGGKQARSPGRARRKPLKPLRRECRVIPV